jgi:small-conductance mechanosensitive channel
MKMIGPIVYAAVIASLIALIFYYWLFTFSASKTRKYTGIPLPKFLSALVIVNVTLCLVSIVYNLILLLPAAFNR